MPLNEYIINDLNPFEVDATISELQEVFNQLTYSHVPIQKKGVFLENIESYEYERGICFVRLV